MFGRVFLQMKFSKVSEDLDECQIFILENSFCNGRPLLFNMSHHAIIFCVQIAIEFSLCSEVIVKASQTFLKIRFVKIMSKVPLWTIIDINQELWM